jgi:hypothetical protein
MKTLRTDATDNAIRTPEIAPIPLSSRLWARLCATRYDRRVEAGDAVVAGSPLAAHHVRLTSSAEREDLSGALLHLMQDAGLLAGESVINARVPIHVDAVRKSADVLEDVLCRLADPTPLRARGMARLRLLLCDGRSPVYRRGAGTLAAEMRGVLAAM